MRDWALRAGDPLSLSFAADLRLCRPDYPNDHIWELDLGGSEPPAVAVRTSYGLRARSMRLFYRFGEGGSLLTDPAEFQSAPVLKHFYPNFLQLAFVPFDGLEATAEFWVPESHVLAGRLTLINRKSETRRVNLELCGLLTPLEGKSLAETQLQMINVLSGRTGGLSPVLFMAGGVQHGPAPYPSLALDIALEPALTRGFSWAIAAESTPEASLDLARRTTGRNWEAERTRIELLDASSMLEIQTGDADWDAVLAFSQRAAISLFFPGSEQLPNPSFVRFRQPDGGHSHAGDGLDYPPAWSGQSALDAYYLSSLLPTAPDLRRGLIENFLSVQTEEGAIDGRPGLSGQRARFSATPLLATLTWNYFQEAQDEPFLASAFPRLLALFENWCSAAHASAGDGLPVWEHVLQTGLDENPLFDVWHTWSQGLPISTLHNPELEALLHREAASLILMAEKLGREAEVHSVHQHAAILRDSVAASWNETGSLYRYRDRRTGSAQEGRQLIGQRRGSGDLHPAQARFGRPIRLLVQVQRKGASSGRPVVGIEGHAAEANQSERIEDRQFQLHALGLVAVTEKVYSSVERISVEGLESQDRLYVRAIDTSAEDITLFMPLWAHLSSPEQARLMLGRLLEGGTGFDRPFGIPALAATPPIPRARAREAVEADAIAMSVHLPWNHMIGEGALTYGLRTEAAVLVTRMMNAVVHGLKQNRVFYERYHAASAAGLGERGALTGFAPVGLFLQTLGVQILSQDRVRLEGANPFPWPVTIFYRGLKLVRGAESTEILFPSGKTVTVADPAPCVVSM